MDTKALLEQLLTTGKSVASKGQAMAEEKLNVPESGEQRDAMLSGMGKGAIAAGLLAALIGTKTGRKVTGSAIKVGSVAALGTIAYKAYQSWQASNTEQDSSTPIHQLSGPDANQRSIHLLQAMIAAANADGHIDATEQATLLRHVQDLQLPAELADSVKHMIANPLSVDEVIANTHDQTQAGEVYVASRLFIEPNATSLEQAYLEKLVDGLQLQAQHVEALEKSIA